MLLLFILWIEKTLFWVLKVWFKLFLGAKLLYESLCLYVCMYYCRYVCLSHFFRHPYILQLTHFTDILIKYKIFLIKNTNFSLKYLFQKSSLFIDKTWVFTISFYICQNIHFADILIKYKIFRVKNTNFLFFKIDPLITILEIFCTPYWLP